MNKEFDYENLYLINYKKLPNYYFLGVLLATGIIATITAFSFFAIGGNFALLGLAVLIFGWLIAVGFANYIRWFVSVTISQSIVVADTLLASRNNNTANNSEQNHPKY